MFASQYGDDDDRGMDRWFIVDNCSVPHIAAILAATSPIFVASQRDILFVGLHANIVDQK